MTNNPSGDYPVQFRVEYPDGPRDRGSVLVRILLAIPILIIASLLSGSSALPQESTGMAGPEAGLAGAGLAIATALMILFRQKYPRWWFDFVLALSRFSARIGAYLLLLRDDYPSTDEHQAVHLDIAYPDATELNRVLPLFKWLLAIPHYIVLSVLSAVAVVIAVFSWIAILVTGQQPKWAFEFLEGVMRWWLRVAAYAFLLTTDRYPPFNFF
ncbi:MAG: DUF4389 domain-containing protein [Spirochaetaceae bacterium]|nr:DUF4389 domain-containing protein [Spirochaetaceae bacterium]